ncbi:hypothetical protein MMC22_012115 [Lobaria immixta]|nr:hypothetical protein [Lobaria immixta]
MVGWLGEQISPARGGRRAIGCGALTSHPFAPTEFPKGWSAAGKRSARRRSHPVTCTPQEEDSSRPPRLNKAAAGFGRPPNTPAEPAGQSPRVFRSMHPALKKASDLPDARMRAGHTPQPQSTPFKVSGYRTGLLDRRSRDDDKRRRPCPDGHESGVSLPQEAKHQDSTPATPDGRRDPSVCRAPQPKRSKHLPSAAKHQGSAPTTPAPQLEALPRRDEPPRNSTHAGRCPGRVRAPDRVRSTMVVASELPGTARTRPTRSARGGRCRALEKTCPGHSPQRTPTPQPALAETPPALPATVLTPLGQQALRSGILLASLDGGRELAAREAPPKGLVLTAQPPHVASESTAQCLQVSRTLAFSAMRPRPPALPDRRAALNATPNPPRTSRSTPHPSGHVVRDREPGSGGDALTNAPPQAPRDSRGDY